MHLRTFPRALRRALVWFAIIALTFDTAFACRTVRRWVARSRCAPVVYCPPVNCQPVTTWCNGPIVSTSPMVGPVGGCGTSYPVESHSYNYSGGTVVSDGCAAGGCSNAVDSGVVVHESASETSTDDKAADDSLGTVTPPPPEETDAPRDLPASLDEEVTTSTTTESSPVDSNPASASEPMEEDAAADDNPLDFLNETETAPAQAEATDTTEGVFPLDQTPATNEADDIESLLSDDAGAATLDPTTELPADDAPALPETDPQLPADNDPTNDLFPAEAGTESAADPTTNEVFPPDMDEDTAPFPTDDQPLIPEGTPEDDGFGDLFGEEPAAEPAPAGGDETDPFGDIFKSASRVLTAPAHLMVRAKQSSVRAGSLLITQLSNVGAFVALIAPEAVDPLAEQTVREWIDNTGIYRTQGKLVKVTETHVRLLKTNGRHTTVPLRRLSKADLQFVRELSQQRDADPLFE